ncbi:hypothetical protein J416_09054 [Gracilibacillus halophilus YIM-C55.5]|uniref:DUF4260 domain-containing protein n=1 Tax=Gracilibacillus halophilus YIM-C55.5 TaxID=1308866 RepID=N4WKQ1_9BACI|nr:DUF4260 domain-containing protein [Gracilibacillus halophilus]ENH96747.1 hypothetical protein J416_09054 [Gracilibacillus halophilus YIM-C55.5]
MFNKVLLHVEGLVVLVLSSYLYFSMQFSWLLFVAFLLAPDLSALGYLKNNKVGSILYNLCHTYSIPIVIIIYGMLVNNHISLMIGFIWVAHIGMDRMIGYGLKYPTKFQDTHLNRV